MEGGDGVAIRFHLRNSGSGLHRKSPPGARIWNQPLGRLIQGFLLLLISETHAGPLRTWPDNFRPSSLFILTKLTMRLPSSGGPLSEGDVQGTRVTCPWHGADFDLKTGAVLGICCKQFQAPATQDLTFNGRSVERTSRRALGSILSALSTLGEPGMGPNVVQEKFLRPGPNRSNGGVIGSWRGSCTCNARPYI
jgi:hypothetical protein